MTHPIEDLTTAEVGVLFRVTPHTVARWANEGRITAIRTSGGYRIPASEVERLLAYGYTPASVVPAGGMPDWAAADIAATEGTEGTR